jgi:hypothetical protein
MASAGYSGYRICAIDAVFNTYYKKEEYANESYKN